MTTAARVPDSAGLRHGLDGERAEVLAARALGCRPKTVKHFMYGHSSAFTRVETIVRALGHAGELARAKRLCAGILRALGDAPSVRFSPALIVQEASACGDLEASRAAFQANPCGATCKQLLRVLEAHERSECEVCAALASEYQQ